MSGPWEEYKKGPWDEFSKNKPKERTSLWEDIKIGAANAGGTLDTAVSMLAGGAADLFGQEDDRDDIFANLDKRLKKYQELANPGKKEQGVMGKVAGNVATLPLQVLTFPLSPFSTGKTAIDSGESLSTAQKAIGIDSVGNYIGAALPVSKGLTAGKKILSGGVMNAAQDVGTKKALQSIMDTEAGKKAFDPTMEDALVAGIVGAGMGAAFRNNDQRAKVERDKFAKLQEVTEAKKAEVAPTPEVTPPKMDGELDLFGPDQNRVGLSPYETDRSAWRVDEDGIPYKEDLSQELGRTERVGGETGDLFETPRALSEVDRATELAKQADIERAYAENPQSNEKVLDARAEEAERIQTQQQLTELEQSLRDSAYRPTGDGQGPKTRAAKASMNRGVKRGQGGGLDISLLDPLFAKTKALAKAVGDLGDYIPKDPDVEALLPQIRGEADVAFSTSKNLESGGTLAAMNRRSSAIMLGSRIVQNAQKRADLAVKRFVFPVEDTFRSLNKEEIKTVMDVVKAEVFAQQKFDMADLESTLSVKQLAAYNSFRKMNEDTLRIQNEARVAANKKPITELEYYAASSWQGVFKQPVRDSEGKLVWYLAGDTQRAINKQWEALKKQFPDLVLKPEEMHRSDQNHGKSKLEKAYTTVLDILDRDDPAVQAIKEAYEKMQADQTANTLGQQKHFKTKTGVRGFVGDRPGFDKTKEAVNYIQSQIQYSKNALMWAEMQKAGENFNKLTSDPELNTNQPKNVAYLKDYWKTNLGFGEAEVFTKIDEAIRSAGVSPTAFAKAVGNTKAFFIMQKLALSPGYIASNFIQTLSILPHMVDMYSKGYKGNPIKAMAVGTPVGLVTAAQHWFGASGEKQALLATMLPGDSRFYTEAIKYAEDNGVVSRSSYDESPISTSLSAASRVGNFIGKASMSYPESVIRSITFMTAAQQLRDSGKFKNNADLFQRAEEMVNVAMVDYRQGERPMLFAKAGTFGNALNTLQTFPANFYNQWRYFGKEALQGNPAPFLTAFALQMTLAGAMGIPGVADADKLWQFLKSKLPASVWSKVKNNEFLADPKLWALKYMGEPAVYGALSDYSGVAMTSRMSAPSFADMAAAPVGPIADIAGQVGSAASLAMDPMNPTKQAQAAMNSSPVGMQGLVEQQMFPEETGVEMQNGKRGVFNSRKLNDRENVYSRSNEKEFVFDTMSEQDIRNWGVRSQRETATKESLYRSKYNKQISTEKAGDVADNFYQAIRKGDAKKATEMGKLYVDLSGQPLKNSQIVARLKKEYIDALDRQAMGIKTVEDVRRYKMLQDVLNEID